MADKLNRFLRFTGRWDEDVRLSMLAYEAMRFSHDWGNAGICALQVLSIQSDRGQMQEVLLWQNRCVEGFMKSDQAVYQEVGNLLSRLSPEQIIDQGEDFGVGLLSLYKSWSSDMDSLLIAGDVAKKRKDYEEAERHYRIALKFSQETGSKDDEAELQGDLGDLALECKQWEDAHKWFEQELVSAQEIGQQELISHAKYGLARVHEAEGHADLALPLAEESLKIYERLRHKDLAEVREFVEKLKKAQR